MQRQAALTTGKSFQVPGRKEPAAPRRTTYSDDYVRSLFDRIAPRYDLLNHVLSSGIDILWRKRAISLLEPYMPTFILDVATGTGDMAIEAARLRPKRIVGVDLAPAMLSLAKRKTSKKGLGHLISYEEASVDRLPYKDASFDAVTVAFGVRNFPNLESGLAELARVVRPGGSAVILEFSRPRPGLTRTLYNVYSRRILPLVGGILSNREAYEYLPKSIREFPDGEDFAAILGEAGFGDIRIQPLTLGIATLYHGIRIGRRNHRTRN